MLLVPKNQPTEGDDVSQSLVSDSQADQLRADQRAAEFKTTPSPAPENIFPSELFNRELSWLEFNRRVLAEAFDERVPLLERARFLSIFSSNLDEFFMKRVGGLRHQVAAGVSAKSPDGMTAAEQLAAIRRFVLPLLVQAAECYHRLLRQLQTEQIEILSWESLSSEERERVNNYFDTHVFRVLTPLAVDPGHPFPFLSNLSTSIGVTVCYPGSSEKLFARIKVPDILTPWVSVSVSDSVIGAKDNRYCFISLTDLIRNNLAKLFPDMVVLSSTVFRITRNADIEREEEDADDLLEMIEEELRQRRFARVIRIEHQPEADPWILHFLREELELSPEDFYEVPGILDFSTLSVISSLPIQHLKFDSWPTVVPRELAEEDSNIFDIIRQRDLLVHHPYESFGQSVERFVRTAIEDPKVLAIKMTVYRTGEDSPFIPLLVRAARAGKQVVCLVELKARFDEEQNIFWAQALERAGVHVVYGIVGLKTHAKTILVVREDEEGLRCYAHIGTGNYHSETANLYTDLSLFTSHPQITEDLVELFHYLTGRSLKRDYRCLLVAPVSLREKLLALIESEIAHAREGRPAQIIAKMNSLEDYTVCRALYRASQAGVKVDLIVRGLCCLKPQVPGLSENIRVISVIGRLLEHSRVFYFQNGVSDPIDGLFYMGSADWMTRNLVARVEVVAPIYAKTLRQDLWEMFQVMLQDKRNVWEMKSDGSYQRLAIESSHDVGTFAALRELTVRRAVTQPKMVESLGDLPV